MMHAMGMMHEQSRDDRDDYVRINWENMKGGIWNNNMWKEDTRDRNPYDLQSVMQYSEYVSIKAINVDSKCNITKINRFICV